MMPTYKKFEVRPGRHAEDGRGNRFYVLAPVKDEPGYFHVEAVATKERYLAPAAELTRVVLEGEKF